MLTAYGAFCSKHKDAVAVYKEVLKADKKFTIYVAVSVDRRMIMLGFDRSRNPRLPMVNMGLLQTNELGYSILRNEAVLPCARAEEFLSAVSW